MTGRLSDEALARLYRERRASLDDLAVLAGKHRRAVRSAIEGQGVPIRPRGRPMRELPEGIGEDLDRVVAERDGVSRTAITHLRRRRGIPAACPRTPLSDAAQSCIDGGF